VKSLKREDGQAKHSPQAARVEVEGELDRQGMVLEERALCPKRFDDRARGGSA
jgi:hypothetical protein